MNAEFIDSMTEMSICLQTHSTINDIFECFLHQIEFVDFKHATASDLREILLLYFDENGKGIMVCTPEKSSNKYIYMEKDSDMNEYSKS